MLAFALSFDDLVITSFNAGVGSTTLPVEIWSSIRFGVTPELNAISTVIVAVIAVILPDRVAARARSGTPPGRPSRSPSVA